MLACAPRSQDLRPFLRTIRSLVYKIRTGVSDCYYTLLGVIMIIIQNKDRTLRMIILAIYFIVLVKKALFRPLFRGVHLRMKDFSSLETGRFLTENGGFISL